MRKNYLLIVTILIALAIVPSGKIDLQIDGFSPFDFPAHQKLKYYGIDNVPVKDFSLVKQELGPEINLIVLGIDCTDLELVRNALEKAEEIGVQLIIWPYGYGHQNTPWHFTGRGWDISGGTGFLALIEHYLGEGGTALKAILMSHEPFWNYGQPFTSDQMKELYSTLKKEAPNTPLFVYINSLAANEENSKHVRIENGIADIAGIWWHNFGKAEGSPGEEDVVTFIKNDIRLIRERGLTMELLFAVQCFGWTGKRYRMPKPAQLLTFGNRVLNIEGLDGILWYSWEDYQVYTGSLAARRMEEHRKVIRFLNSNRVE